MSIRAIADAVGVSPPSIYLHFADKDELIYAVCALQFRKLDVVVSETMAGVDDPLEKLRRRGQAYVRFGRRPSRALPDHAHGQEPLLPGGLRGRPAARACARSWPSSRTSRSAWTSGVFAEDDPFRVATILWAAVHGMTSLLISVPGFPTFQDPEALVDQMLDTLARGLAPRRRLIGSRLAAAVGRRSG